MKSAISKTILAGCAAAALLGTPAAAAERAETVSTVRLVRSDTCPLTPDEVLRSELSARTGEFVGPLLATVFAGLAGSLAQSAVTAAGDALEEASKEKGIVAEGTTSFYMSQLNPANAASKLATVTPRATCLILFSQGKNGPISGLPEEPAMEQLRKSVAAAGLKLPLFESTQEAVLNSLKSHGVTTIPGLYVEARLIPSDEGLRVRPLLVWYRDKMAGARNVASAAEYHITLATPGTSELGTAFAGARMQLPKVTPGRLLDWKDLKDSTSPFIPSRPSAGAVEAKLTAANLAYAQEVTREKELLVAQRTLAAAKRTLKAKPKDTAAQEAHTAADLAVQDAVKSRDSAAAQTRAIEQANVGATNAKARFVVIRDANKFGLALAKALKGQAETVGKGVTAGLAPQPEWTTSDTAYVSALTALSAKEREYNTAITEGNSANAVKLGEEILVLKAKLNEAAVALKRPIPYPSLF